MLPERIGEIAILSDKNCPWKVRLRSYSMRFLDGPEPPRSYSRPTATGIDLGLGDNLSIINKSRGCFRNSNTKRKGGDSYHAIILVMFPVAQDSSIKAGRALILRTLCRNIIVSGTVCRWKVPGYEVSRSRGGGHLVPRKTPRGPSERRVHVGPLSDRRWNQLLQAASKASESRDLPATPRYSSRSLEHGEHVKRTNSDPLARACPSSVLLVSYT